MEFYIIMAFCAAVIYIIYLITSSRADEVTEAYKKGFNDGVKMLTDVISKSVEENHSRKNQAS